MNSVFLDEKVRILGTDVIGQVVEKNDLELLAGIKVDKGVYYYHYEELESAEE